MTVGKVEEIIKVIVKTLSETHADLSDIQLLPDSVPYIRGFISNKIDVNAFVPLSLNNNISIKEEELKDFLYSHISDVQSQLLTKERQISFRLEIKNEDGSTLAIFRATAYYQRDKLSLALRFLKTNILTPSELHVHPIVYTNYMKNNAGLIIVSGPVGSGKTTTAVSLLKDKLISSKNRGALHLVTIEAPVEYEINVAPDEGIVEQREVGVDTPDFFTATRDIVRINPNIIFVGEVRDPETAINCIQMATTGHLVLTTFHSDSVKDTIARFRSFLRTKEDISMFANALVAVTNQRLFTFKTLDGFKVFPIMETVKVAATSRGSDAIKPLIIEDRISEIPNYINIENESVTTDACLNYIKKLIDQEEQLEIVRKPPNPPVSTDF